MLKSKKFKIVVAAVVTLGILWSITSAHALKMEKQWRELFYVFAELAHAQAGPIAKEKEYDAFLSYFERPEIEQELEVLQAAFDERQQLIASSWTLQRYNSGGDWFGEDYMMAVKQCTTFRQDYADSPAKKRERDFENVRGTISSFDNSCINFMELVKDGTLPVSWQFRDQINSEKE